MKSSNRNLTILATLSLAIAGVALASSGDPPACQKAKLSAHLRFHQCVSRCEQRSNDPTACVQGCTERRDARLVKIDARPVCHGSVLPPAVLDEGRCTTQLIKAKLRSLKCEERCDRLARMRENFDVDRCADRCQATFDAAQDRIEALPYCAGLALSLPAM